jgi:hypothetical protein
MDEQRKLLHAKGLTQQLIQHGVDAVHIGTKQLRFR